MTPPSSRLEGLEVTAEVRGSTTILSISGQVDTATTAALAGGIRDALRAQTETLVLDLSAIDRFSAAGLATLFEADGRARAVGSRLVVIPGTGPVRRLLEQTEAQQRLTIAS